jgi:hypothetical protein
VDECADLDLVEATVALWQPRASRELCQEDGRQIVENITGFFAILAEWSRAEMRDPANDAVEPSTSDAGDVRHDS